MNNFTMQLNHSSKSKPSQNTEEFIENLWIDEMRDGFLVTADTKRLWNAQIGCVKEFERICKKYNLRWFISSGTLLGAVRHKGFIPWDNGIDVVMFRPEYEKFRQVVETELNPPYILNAWYNHKLDSEAVAFIDEEDDAKLPVVPFELQAETLKKWPFYSLLKIEDSRTTMIIRKGCKSMLQSAYVKISPLDPAPPFPNKEYSVISEMAQLLFFATTTPWKIAYVIKNTTDVKTLALRNTLREVIKVPFQKRALQFEEFMAKNFFNSPRVCELKNLFIEERKNEIFDVGDFEKVINIPFEKIELPAPIGYDNILTTQYGDWHEIVKKPSEVSDFSVDVPFSEYAEKSLL